MKKLFAVLVVLGVIGGGIYFLYEPSSSSDDAINVVSRGVFPERTMDTKLVIGCVRSLAFDPNEAYLAVGCNELVLFDMRQRREICRASPSYDCTVNNVVFGRDGTHVAISVSHGQSQDFRNQLISYSFTGNELKETARVDLGTSSRSGIHDMALSSSGQSLVTSMEDTSLVSFSFPGLVKRGERIHAHGIPANDWAGIALEFVGETDQFITGGRDQKLVLWLFDEKTGSIGSKVYGDVNKRVASLAVAKDGSSAFLTIGSEAPYDLIMIDSQTLKTTKKLYSYKETALYRIGVDPKGLEVAVGNGSVCKIFDPKVGWDATKPDFEPKHSVYGRGPNNVVYIGHSERITSIKYFDGGEQIVTGNSAGRLCFYKRQ